MDRRRAMAVPVAIAEAGSFAGAARRLRASAPAGTRAVARRWRQLGARLFDRTTRSPAATEAGLRFLKARRLVAAKVRAFVDHAAARLKQRLNPGR